MIEEDVGNGLRLRIEAPVSPDEGPGTATPRRQALRLHPTRPQV